jgi:hypothetical protein
MEKEIKTIEYTLRDIFKRDFISKKDVENANRLFKKWKKLSKYKEDDSSVVETILEKEPIWQIKK